MSNLARQDAREAAAITNKPTVAIQGAVMVNASDKPGKQVLYGYPINHPDKRLNDKMIRTSPVVRVDGDRVETRNTIYNVISWGYE